MKSVSLDVMVRGPAFWTNRSAKARASSCSGDVLGNEEDLCFDVMNCGHTLPEEWR